MGKVGMGMTKFQGIFWSRIHGIDGAVPKKLQEDFKGMKNLGILLKFWLGSIQRVFPWLVFPGIPVQVVPLGNFAHSCPFSRDKSHGNVEFPGFPGAGAASRGFPVVPDNLGRAGVPESEEILGNSRKKLGVGGGFL